MWRTEKAPLYYILGIILFILGLLVVWDHSSEINKEKQRPESNAVEFYPMIY